MSPLRVADAARIAPYPPTMSPHGQITPIPLDNAGRNRKLKPTKKAERKPERRRDNEGVSMHVISPRKQPISREPRPERDCDDDEASIPDYPPPSFLEAISTPPLSVCPSLTRASTPSPLSPTTPDLVEPQSLADSVALDSDESLEIIDATTVPVSNEPIRRRSRWRSATEPTPHTVADPIRRRALLDSDDEDSELALAPNRARHLSLSPFRLLAKPSAPSPLPFRHTSFFRSTTSLKAINTSMPRLPLASTWSPRSESPLGRKLFSKGKERSRSRETLDSWEVLESEPPASLLSAVESVTSPCSSAISSPISPTELDQPQSASTENLSPITPRARRAPPPPPPPRRGGAKSPTCSPMSDPFDTTPVLNTSLPDPSPIISPSTPQDRPTMRAQRPYVAPLYTSPIPSSSTYSLSTPTRHHYLGRPLPPRPTQETIQARCPEGLLVDLDDQAPVALPSSRSPIELTDLDLLLSRIELDDSSGENGTNYDALLLLSEIMGPGPPATGSPFHQPSLESELVSVERRRVTKDGRVKLKLVLMGVAVDRCGICLTQFKEGDRGVVGKQCRHSFHQKCIERWVARSSTCPLCREAWR